MAINTSWDDDAKTRIRLDIHSGWTWADLYDAIAASDALIVSVPHQVDIILHLTHGTHIPTDFMTVAKDLLAKPEPRPNEGKRVIVGAGHLLRFAYHTLQRAFATQLQGRDIHFADSLEDARRLLDEWRVLP